MNSCLVRSSMSNLGQNSWSILVDVQDRWLMAGELISQHRIFFRMNWRVHVDEQGHGANHW